MFTEKTGIEVRVVAVGTGQAIRNAANGDGDVLLVHARAAEEQFVADGYGVARHDMMYNDFVVVGPPADPAGVSGMTDAVTALAKIAASEAPFASRGDDSGTHKAELELWQEAGVDVEAASGGWYRETGSGMGTTPQHRHRHGRLRHVRPRHLESPSATRACTGSRSRAIRGCSTSTASSS